MIIDDVLIMRFKICDSTAYLENKEQIEEDVFPKGYTDFIQPIYVRVQIEPCHSFCLLILHVFEFGHSRKLWNTAFIAFK